MRKVVISLVTAASLLLTTATIDAKATSTVGQASVQTVSTSDYTYETVTKVASTKATAKSGSFKLNIIRMSEPMRERRTKSLLQQKKDQQQLRLTRKKLGKKLGIKLKLAGNQVGF